MAPYYEDADITVLAGCALCQPFSAYARPRKRQAAGDCALVDAFARLIRESRPDFVSMENMPGLAQHPTFRNFLAALEELAYQYAYGIVSCLGYGVPQTRQRLVLLASRVGAIFLPRPTPQHPDGQGFHSRSARGGGRGSRPRGSGACRIALVSPEQTADSPIETRRFLAGLGLEFGESLPSQSVLSGLLRPHALGGPGTYDHDAVL